MRLKHTPIESYDYQGWKYWVKREDLCGDFSAPTFSKIRGLIQVLRNKVIEGKTHIGYTETSISMAGWGVAWGCQEMGLKAVIFDPQYKKDHPGKDVLDFHRSRWKMYEAEIIPVKAGMAKVNYNIARKILQERYGKTSEMLPLGLPFKETVLATLHEATTTRLNYSVDFNTVVVNVGSGTVAAGVASGFSDKKVYGVMGRTGDIERKLNSICKKGRFIVGGMTGIDFTLIDPGWGYTERCDIEVPFPCHPYYDAKAFKWMVDNRKQLKPPVLFWNIGSLPFKE